MRQTVAKVVALVERLHQLGIKLYVWYHEPSLFLNIWYGIFKEHGENVPLHTGRGATTQKGTISFYDHSSCASTHRVGATTSKHSKHENTEESCTMYMYTACLEHKNWCVLGPCDLENKSRSKTIYSAHACGMMHLWYKFHYSISYM